MTLERYKEKLRNYKLSKNDNNEKDDMKDLNNSIKVNEIKNIWSDITPDDETYSSTSEWENVSKDTCQFTLLIGNLEDITVLNTIIKYVL